jgi:uncharacterized HAD superfamily protein
MYLDYYREFRDIDSELFTSHLIGAMILDNVLFKGWQINEDTYEDWGTYEEWIAYKNKFRTLFVDIDGVLFENGSRFFEPNWAQTKPIQSNIDSLKSIASHSHIVLTTSRTLDYEIATRDALKRYGVPYNDIIFGLPHSRRVLINDFSATNPYPSAVALNIKRNDDNLNDLLISSQNYQ